MALREIQRWLRRSTGQPRGEGGSVTVAQRFGSALDLNLHFHILALDGLYCEDPNDGTVRWFRSPAPTDLEVSTLVEQIADRAEAFLARRGFGIDEDQDEDPDDALGVIQAAAVAGRCTVRRSRQARRVGVQGGRPYQLPPTCAHCDGYGLHAGVVIGEKERKGLEGLARYIARPPLATPRLEELPDGGLRIRFKRHGSDGTEGIEVSRIELVLRPGVEHRLDA